jgi:hypothetical protein
MYGGTLSTRLALITIARGATHALLLAPRLGIVQWGQAAQSWLLGSASPFSTVRKEVVCHGKD